MTYALSLTTTPLLPVPEAPNPEYAHTQHLDQITIAILVQLGLPTDAHGCAVALLTMPTYLTTRDLVHLCDCLLRDLDPTNDPDRTLQMVEVINAALDSHEYSSAKAAPAGLASIGIDCAILRGLALRAINSNPAHPSYGDF